MPFLGVDIGGTAVKLAIVDASGVLHAQAEHPVNFDGYKTPILETALDKAASFCKAQGLQPEGVGISAAGQIDVHEGIVAGTCGNIPGYEGSPLRQAFTDAFGVPATAMNDVNCALIGEAWKGRAQGIRNAVMVTLGTGVGCAALVDGAVLSGQSGFAGEGGHFPTHAGGVMCTCGNRGCYEQYASVTVLLRMAREACVDAPENGRAFFARVAAGDDGMAHVLEQWIEEIAAGLTGLVHLFNPEMVLIGGGVSGQEALLIEPVRRRVLAQAMPRYRDNLQVASAALGNSAGVLGAVRNWLTASNSL